MTPQRSSFEDHFLPDKREQKPEQSNTGFTALLDIASELHIRTPDRETCEKILGAENLLHEDWMKHPMTQKLLLALRVMARVPNDEARQLCDSPGESDLRIRTLLAKSKTINEIIKYVTIKDQSSVTLPRF